jgi:hypothetical protein
MGHKIHPDKFRLGISKDWQYQVRDPLLANVFISKTVRHLFSDYSAPYVSYTIRRDVNPRELVQEELKARMIENPFLRTSLIFSHLNISYAPSLLLAIFLLDSDAEHRRAKEKQREKTFYYLSGSFSHEAYRAYSYFRKNMYLKLYTDKGRRAMSWRRYAQFYRSGLGSSVGKTKHNLAIVVKKLKKRFPNFFITRKSFRKSYKFPIFILNRFPYKYLPAWVINNYHFFFLIKHYKNIFKNLKILLFLLRYFKKVRYQNFKRRLFFYHLLIKSLTSFLYLLFLNNHTRDRRKKLLTVFNVTLYLQSILFIQLTTFKNVYLKYNKKLFQSRLLFFNLYAKILHFTLRKTTFITNDRQLIIKFFALHNRNLSAQFLVNYICLKLGQYFDLNSIIKPIIRRFKRQDSINGFRFIISGRLTRKERAAYIVKSHKAMPLSSAAIKIDYACDFKIMRFGVVGIKVYLLAKEDIPYYYYFEFKNKI